MAAAMATWKEKELSPQNAEISVCQVTIILNLSFGLDVISDLL